MSYVVPVIASRPLGTMFHVVGTAATQYSRTAPDATGAATAVAAPDSADGHERGQPPHWTVTVPCMNGWIMQ